MQHLCRGTEGLQGAPSTEALPCNPGKRTCIACAWAPLWAAGGALTFVHFSFHFVLRHSFVSDVARGRNLTPDGSSHLVLHAILDVWHVWHKTFHPIFVHHHHHHPPHSPLSRFGSCPLPNLSVCVCVSPDSILRVPGVRVCNSRGHGACALGHANEAIEHRWKGM